MWVLIDRKWRFVFLAAIVLIISIGYEAVALYKEVPSTLSGLSYQLIASIFSAIGTTALLVTFLGPRHLLWAWSLRLPGMRTLLKFPDVNGTWIGWRSSSYVEGEVKAAGAAPPAPGMMRLIIRQSWLRVQVNSVNESGRTVSHSVNAFPELQEGSPLIWSVYRGEVEAPGPTEGPTHNGGALLHIAPGGARIFGTYFSDRGIAHHKPSSGRFELWRFSDNPDLEEVDRTAVADFLRNHPP